MAPLACGAKELDQRQLDFLVPGVAVPSALRTAEDRADAIGVAAHHVEQDPLAGRLVMGDGGFDQVAGAVQLVQVA